MLSGIGGVSFGLYVFLRGDRDGHNRLYPSN